MEPLDTAPGSETTPLVVLGLGANLGDRLANLRAAVAGLTELPEVRVRGRSSVYETPPAGGPPQPDYLNAAVAVETSLAPGALLDRLLAIERALGRVRPDAVRWGPRLIDIDILWMAGASHGSADLLVPHPRLAERPFALVPLLELIPDATDPTSGQRYDSLAAAQVSLDRVGAL